MAQSASSPETVPPIDQKELNKFLDVSLQDLFNVGMVSASKKKQSVTDAPAIAYVVTEDQMKTRGYVNLVELIEDIPEVEIQYNSNPEFRNLVSFRGVAGNEGILVLINGIRMTPATGDFYTMGANFSLVDAVRVEVIIGPASALYGVDAFGGIINIITHNQDGRNFSGVTVNTSGGNYGTTNNSFNIGFKVDKLLVNVAASQYISAEPDYNNKYDLTYNWYNKSFQPKGNVIESPYYGDIYNLNFFKDRTGKDKSLNNISQDFAMPTEAHYIHANVVYDKFTAGYMNNSERHSTAYGLDPRYTAYDKDQFFRQTQHVFYLKHNYTSFNKKWNLQSSLRHNFYDVDPNSNYVGSASRWQRGYVYANGQGTKFEEQLSVDVSARSSFIGGISYELLNTLPMTGLATHPVDVHKPISLDEIYYIGAAGYDAYATDANAGKNDPANVLRQTLYPISYYNVGSFLQWQWKRRKIDITSGVRWDYNSRFGHTVNPRIGLVYTPIKRFTIKMLVGSSYLAPSPEKSFKQSGAFYSVKYDSDLEQNLHYADYFRVPNTELKPEKLYSFELGLNYFVTENLSVGINSFYTHISDIINLYGNSTDTVLQYSEGITAKKYESTINEGYADIYGAAFKANYLIRFDNAKVNLYASWNLMHSKIRQDFNHDGTLDGGEFAPFVSNSNLKFGADVSFKRFEFSLRGNLRGKTASNQVTLNQTNDGLDNVNNYRNIQSPAYFVLNANALYKIKMYGKTQWTAFIRCRNLLDARYYNAAYGSEDGIATAPQDPMRIMGGLTFSIK